MSACNRKVYAAVLLKKSILGLIKIDPLKLKKCRFFKTRLEAKFGKKLPGSFRHLFGWFFDDVTKVQISQIY